MPISDAVTALERDLREMFGDRLRSVVVYDVTDRGPGTPQPTLVIVEALTPADLRACAGLVSSGTRPGSRRRSFSRRRNSRGRSTRFR